jgi:hypothetical protein
MMSCEIRADQLTSSLLSNSRPREWHAPSFAHFHSDCPNRHAAGVDKDSDNGLKELAPA